MRLIVLFLLLISFVSAVDFNFDCPDEIFVDEEFVCSLEVFDGDGVYDVKVDLDGERNSVLEIWDDGNWKSGYYYLKNFIEDGEEKNVKLKILKDGEYDWVLKLRQGNNREDFDIERVYVEEGVFEKEGVEKKKDEKEDGGVVLSEEKEPIVLNGERGVSLSGEVVYMSKDAKVGEYLIYGFALFLIFIIGILVWERV